MNTLVLNKDSTILDVFKKRLEQDGFLCLTASTAQEAWAKSRITKIHVLLVEFYETPAVEFVLEYRKQNPWVRVFALEGDDPVPSGISDKVMRRPFDFDAIVQMIGKEVNVGPREVAMDTMKLDDRDTMIIVELVNKVVEHTNIVATTQSLITENIEELVDSQERSETKLTYIYQMLQEMDKSGILKMYVAVQGFFKQFLSKMFWAVIILMGMYMLKSYIMEFLIKVLHK